MAFVDVDDTGLEDETMLAALRALADGAGDVDLEGDEEAEAPEFAAADHDPEDDHDANLADQLTGQELAAIASEVIKKVKYDLDSRLPWYTQFNDGLKFLGVVDDKQGQVLFKGGSRVVHPLLSEAIVQFQARAMAELMPPTGPVKTKTIGKRTEEKIKRGKRVANYMNYYLMEVLEHYAEDMDSLLFYLAAAGSAFKKVLLRNGHPDSRFLEAEHVVLDYYASSIEDAARITHIDKNVTPNQIKKLQADGTYIEVDLGSPSPTAGSEPGERERDEVEGKVPSGTSLDDGRHTIYECHLDYNLPGELADDDGIAHPYIVTVDKQSQKVLAIRRNWRQGDPEKERRRWFIHYKYLPGLGVYGFGLIHMIGGLAKSATGGLRGVLDAGAFDNLQGGFKLKSRVPGGEIEIAPGEFIDIETDSDDIRKTVMPLPFKGPSRALIDLIKYVVESAQRFASTTEQMVGDAANTGPVGTTVALIEQGSKVYSGIHARLHRAQHREFKLIAEMIADTVTSYPYKTEDGEALIKDDFTAIGVIPVSDPKIFSQTQRIAQAQTTFQMAQASPHLHDMREAHRRVYEAIGAHDIDGLLLDPDKVEANDPVSENMLLLTGKPIRAYDWEDHQAHIAVHMHFMQSPMLQQEQMQKMVGPRMMAHLAEHFAYAYRQEIQQAMGKALPLPDLHREPGKPEEEPLSPEIQNEIAMQVAEVVSRMKPPKPKSPEEAKAEADAKAKLAETAGSLKAIEVKTEAGIKLADEKAKAEHALKAAKTAADIERADKVAEEQSVLNKARMLADAARADNEAKARARTADKAASQGT